MLRRLASVPGITFALFFAWKLALLIFTAQPVPANDSFFYDGPVVNYLLHGEYRNPALVHALPISGGEVFCAYPPLYQFMLLGWMTVFGTSALAAMWLHLVLLAVYALVVLAIFRQLELSAGCVNLAGLFLFAITFHDRPDTLAHALGTFAVFAAVRTWGGSFQNGGDAGPQNEPGRRTARSSNAWPWSCALLLLLTFSTSLQIGAIYALWIALMTAGSTWLWRLKFLWTAVLAFGFALAGLIVLVRFGFPHLWEGFQEHVRITPSVTGWRAPHLDELLKVARTAPGILLVGTLLAWLAVRRNICLSASPAMFTAISGVIAASALIAGCLVVLTPNVVHVANYLQPVVVGCFLMAARDGFGGWRLARAIGALFVAAALLVSIRAVGLTTWGVACVRDVDRRTALARVKTELDALAPGSTAMISAAYLYDAARRTNINWVHSDWPAAPGSPGGEIGGIIRLRPAKFILTQFDYYRRYTSHLRDLRSLPNPPQIQLSDAATIRPPDAFPSLQRVVQHVSWAPVVVNLNWPEQTK